ncbi:hypothetical protein swp_4989 [Shewanella piezotolerans WP3]|uniref:Uncharacterized protein n=1 Tax=Shewanella piezotolerans (strain WP3 / JCM 13877) TaxID=225849 RepID=B8CVC8_SHEPW|nr:hypothetical protein swp_4989 [Shewanella piezotolerans WP3]
MLESSNSDFNELKVSHRKSEIDIHSQITENISSPIEVAEVIEDKLRKRDMDAEIASGEPGMANMRR